tara:strand:+ start:412 stop:552 length:141 start_codon:yes stop_codon:yes gene_type:complete
MNKKINQLKHLLEKNNIPPLSKEQKHNLLYGSEEDMKRTLINLLKR